MLAGNGLDKIVINDNLNKQNSTDQRQLWSITWKQRPRSEDYSLNDQKTTSTVSSSKYAERINEQVKVLN